MEDSLRSFADARPNADYKALVARFGTPQQIAASYVEEMDTPELMKNMKASKRVVCIVLAVALIALVMWAGVVVTALYESREARENTYFVEEIEVIRDIPLEVEGE